MIESKELIQSLIEIHKGLGKISTFRCEGRSMLPLIAPGSMVSIEHLPAEKIKLGEIIAFRRSSHLVVHRVLKEYHHQGNLFFLEKGDSNLRAGIVEEKNVLGKIVKVKRGRKPITLDTYTWRLINYLVARYGLMINYAFKRFYSVRENFPERKENLLAKIGQNTFRISLYFFPKVLIMAGIMGTGRGKEN